MSAEKEAFVIDPDGWCQLSPLGEFYHSRAKVTQVIDSAACAKIAEEVGRQTAVGSWQWAAGRNRE